MGVNRLEILGNLVKDPVYRVTLQNRRLLNFRVAVSQKYYDKEHRLQEHVLYQSCMLYGNFAENLSKRLRKGSRIFVEGPLITRSWISKTTKEKKYENQMAVHTITLLDHYSPSEYKIGKHNDTPKTYSATVESNEQPETEGIADTA